MKHYHIRWDSPELDWQAFETEDEAEKVALHLKRPREKYAIVEQDGNCPRCAEFKRKAESHSAKPPL